MAWMALAMAGVSAYTAKQKADAAQAGGDMMGMTNKPDLRTNEAVFDNSGWNVSFGSSKIDSTASKTTELSGASAPGAGLTAGGGSGLGFVPAMSNSLGITEQQMIYGAVAVGLLLVWKKKKS